MGLSRPNGSDTLVPFASFLYYSYCRVHFGPPLRQGIGGAGAPIRGPHEGELMSETDLTMQKEGYSPAVNRVCTVAS